MSCYSDLKGFDDELAVISGSIDNVDLADLPVLELQRSGKGFLVSGEGIETCRLSFVGLDNFIDGYLLCLKDKRVRLRIDHARMKA
jgi:hypothetical protein